ncbi:flagellar motor protein MotS [Bacillus chungangensis]|uniref:Chemotaxis protein MotB n=1 Tax=Bacillus chungangensis TaxID=587633 RepID=A0ABT9WUP6_9BACI|nr:flagellar motor protein MotS [Bacillus chungangensis]MDQ0176854.1 chemotaxis protein MotB [Bacillus chungangensis]
MRYRRPVPKKPEKGAPKWMVTFSDLITLVLVFFILLFSVSQVDAVKFKQITESLRQSQILDHYPSILEQDSASPLPDAIDDEKKKKQQDKEDADNLERLLGSVQAYLIEHDLEEVAVATRTERGVVLVLQEQVLFQTGDASILESAHPFLDKVGTLLGSMPNLVKIEGHTDSRPINNFRYPSNWELSTARASSVIRFLTDSNGLDPARFIAVGYGDTRPVASNDNPDNWEKNRRVEIIISDPKYEEEEETP